MCKQSIKNAAVTNIFSGQMSFLSPHQQNHRTRNLRTHTHTQPFYGSLDFVQDNPGEPVPE